MPSTPARAAEGLRRGRRLRARRRALAAGAFALTASLLTGGLLIAGGGDPVVRTPVAAPGTGGESEQKAAEREKAEAQERQKERLADQPPADPRDLSGPGTVRILIDLLPDGAPVGSYAGGRAPGSVPESADGQVIWDDGKGAVEVGASVSTDVTANVEVPDGLADWKAQITDCDKNTPGSTVVGCVTTPRPDDGFLQRRELRLPDGTVRLEAKVWRKSDDVLVSAITSTGKADYKGPQVRDEPVLTLDQLAAIVLSPRWTPRVDPEFTEEAARTIKPFTDLYTSAAVPDPTIAPNTGDADKEPLTKEEARKQKETTAPDDAWAK